MDELFEQDDVRKKVFPSRDIGLVMDKALDVSDDVIDNKKSSGVEHVENMKLDICRAKNR